MTITLELYTKKFPDLSNLIVPWNLKGNDELEGYNSYTWNPNNTKDTVFIILKETPEIYGTIYDKEIITDMIESAKRGVYEVPKELIDKFRRDDYIVFADRKLARIVYKNPDIKKSLPFLEKEFTFAEFSKGRPLFNTQIEAREISKPETFEIMLDFANYLSNEYDGIVYEEKTNRFGVSNIRDKLSLVI
ncbi:MAG: hypothetical protein WC867_05830 [Candidatus Pacearchaeota archaeon]|jgi:hypothetical protein